MIIISYIFGFLAIIYLVISFQTDDTKVLLKDQVISSFFNGIQYLLIGSLSGAFMNLIAGARNIVYKKYDKKIPLFILIFFILLITFFSMMSYKGNISLLPMLAVLNYSFALWTGDLRLIRIINVSSSLLFLIYDLFVSSIMGFILHLLEMSSALISIYRFDFNRSER